MELGRGCDYAVSSTGENWGRKGGALLSTFGVRGTGILRDFVGGDCRAAKADVDFWEQIASAPGRFWEGPVVP